jgi:hypothetical protein
MTDDKLRWSAVSLRGGHAPADADSAKAALDRITIPQDALNRIAATAPKSSLIVTDEPPIVETGQGTEFVVLLSGEPQGGIQKRRRSPGSGNYYARSRGQPYWGSPFGNPFGW